MSIQAVAWAFSQKLPCAQKFVLVSLADFANAQNECFPSQRKVAERCGLSRQSVNIALAALEENGFITMLPQSRRDGSDGVCVYRLEVPNVDQTLQGEPSVPGHVYVVTSGGRTKVGISRNVEKRLKGFRTAFPAGVDLIKTWDMPIRTARLVERMAHEALNSSRLAGEWFSVSASEAVACVEKIIEGGPVKQLDRPVQELDTPCQAGRQALSTSLTPILEPSLVTVTSKKNPRNWPDDFREQFWKLFPRKAEKKAAIRRLEQVRASGEIGFAELLAAVRAIDTKEPEFIKYPATWLHKGCYADHEGTTGPPSYIAAQGTPEFAAWRDYYSTRKEAWLIVHAEAHCRPLTVPTRWPPGYQDKAA